MIKGLPTLVGEEGPLDLRTFDGRLQGKFRRSGTGPLLITLPSSSPFSSISGSSSGSGDPMCIVDMIPKRNSSIHRTAQYKLSGNQEMKTEIRTNSPETVRNLRNLNHFLLIPVERKPVLFFFKGEVWGFPWKWICIFGQ